MGANDMRASRWIGAATVAGAVLAGSAGVAGASPLQPEIGTAATVSRHGRHVVVSEQVYRSGAFRARHGDRVDVVLSLVGGSALTSSPVELRAALNRCGDYGGGGSAQEIIGGRMLWQGRRQFVWECEDVDF